MMNRANKQKIAILGATGSIGTQVRQVLGNEYVIALVSANKQGRRLRDEFANYPSAVRIYSNDDYPVDGSDANKHFHTTRALGDPATFDGIDVVVNGISGFAGIAPSFAALRAGAKLITANKETFVAGGGLFMRMAKELGAKVGERILPIDSEHSAIWTCLNGEESDCVDGITITASGGAFRDLSKEEISRTNYKDALNNPNWKMGKKVTVDTATLMNKGFELIEAKHLFGTNNVKAVVHRESLIHASVTFRDGTSKLVYYAPDMRIPIQYALTHPKRCPVTGAPLALDICALSNLTFSEPDRDKFPCFALAEKVLASESDYLGAVFCVADEVAVDLYLNGKLNFYGISDAVECALNKFNCGIIESVEDILSIEREVREYIICKFGGEEC